MKIKRLLLCDVILIFLIALIFFIISLSKGSGELGFVFFALILPHAIVIPPCVWFLSLSKITKLAGDETSGVRKYNSITILTIFSLWLMFLVYVYCFRTGWVEGVGGNVFILMIAVSHALSLTTAILTGMAAYTMFIRMSARGYKKLMK